MKRTIQALSFLTSIALSGIAPAQTIVNSVWHGDGSANFSNGNWSNASLWNPTTVPNDGGGSVYDVTLPMDPNGAQFNGPQLDIDVTIRNLTLSNRAFLDNQFNVGTSLTRKRATKVSWTLTELHDGSPTKSAW